METTKGIEAAVHEIKLCTQEIKKSVMDLSTQVALHKQAISRVWWFVGIIMIVFIGTGVKVWFF